MIYSSYSLGCKNGLQMQHRVACANKHTKHNLFPTVWKLSSLLFISPSHLYTLACRTVTLLLQPQSKTIPHASFRLITINMWLWPPRDVFFLCPPLFQAGPMAVTWFLITVIVFPHLTLRWSHQLFFSLFKLFLLLLSLSTPTSFSWPLTLFFQWWWWCW